MAASTHTPMPAPVSNGHTNGQSNGNSNGHSNESSQTLTKDITAVHNISNESHVVQTKRYEESHTSRTENRTTTTTSHAHNFTTDQQVTVLRQTVIATRSRLIAELSHVNAHYIDAMTVESFLEYIECERLTHMPRRGSRWDKVLKWAEFFALQISGYEKAVHRFVPDSKNAAKMIWAACRVLIELGPCNSQALETAFEVFYKVGLSLSFFLQHHELLSINSHIRTEVGQAFNELLILVRDVSIYYRTRISALSSTEVVIDFNSVFGRNISSFYRRKDHIVDAMWECRLGDDSTNVSVIRKWLGIHDNIVKTIERERVEANSHRDEYTCEWMQRPLLDFSRGKEDVLAVTAPSGCGKSVLAGWVVERLQRPLGKKSHETLSITIDPEIPSQCSGLAVAKNLALQLLVTNIGDVELLDALEKVYNLSIGSSNLSSLENELWKALDTGLKNVNADNLMIVIDGLDDRCGLQNAVEISTKIGAFASKYEPVRAIIFSRNSAHLSKEQAHILAITPDHTHNDLQHITEHAFHGYENFSKQNDHEQEAIVEKIAHAAKGNFLNALLMVKGLKQQTSPEAFTKAVKSIKEAPPQLKDSIQNLVTAATSDFAKPETNLVLSWLLVAERPLTISELKGLLQVDLQKKTLLSRKTDAAEDIQNLCGPLVKVQNGIVRFRHGAIREYLVKVQAEGKKLPAVQSAQGDLSMRLLAYCNLRFTDPCGSGFELPDKVEIDRLFLQDTLLEYAARNWILHFKKSTWHKASGSFDLPHDFKANFPGSVYLSLIEWTCWESQTSAFEAINLHNLALRLRQAIFTEKHESVLQTLIICGNLYRKLLNVTEAGLCFYRASRIGQSILKTNSNVTIDCTTSFLEVTETTTITSRTEIITRKEEMLQYAITACKQRYGKTSDVVIRHCTTLAEMYVAIHEEHKAETVWRELREIMIIRHGKGSVEETTISGHINVVLKADQHDEIIEYEKNIFDTDIEMEIWDIRRIKITLRVAASYEAHGDLLKAEELYVMLWSQLIEHCHQIHIHHVDIDVHISMIDISLEYVRFLRRCHRHEEAAGVLICIWNEYEEYDFESEIIFLRLKTIGELMRSISLLTIAVTVFKKCWSWFKSHGKHEHVESCQTLISQTTEEIITTTTTETSTVSTTTTETVIKEVFESTVSKSTVTTETISICRSLVSFYIKSEQWSEAIITSKKSLQLIWRMIVSGGGTIALPREFASEAIEIAIQLAMCHHRLHHFHEAESVYIRIYRACFNSCQVQDERLIKAYTTLIKFYQENGHWHKVIEVYQELLIASRKQHGASHSLTVKILYELGSLCSEHGHGHPHEYYEEIITVLNIKSHVCHHDALRAMQILCKTYYEEGHWQKLKSNCEVLWETWTHHHKEHKFEADFIELLYMRYIYVLEHHSHAGHEVIRTITIQFRDTCVVVFGASVSITIRALIELAQICMRSEKHIHEAISYYEEVIKTVTSTTTVTTTTVVSTTTISTVKQQLTKAYIHVCTHGSASKTTLERAIFILTERFEHLKITLGYSHTETLTVLRELVLMYWKQSTKETHSTVVRILLEATIAIISKEKRSRTLYEAAKTMGLIYISCGLLEDARMMLHEIHRQLVSRSYTSGSKHDFKIDQSIGRGSYVFLVTFEEVILGSSSMSYSKIMADLLTETILYESYSRCLKSEKDMEVVVCTGARLYVFLAKTSRKEQVTIVQEELQKIFLKKWGSNIKTSNEITTIFFISLLQELGSATRQIEIDHAACKSSNDKVRELVSKGLFRESYEVALCAFQFLGHRGAYHHLQNVGYGFKLSAFMASRGLKKLLEKPVEPELRAKMLQLSRDIISEVLKACKDSEISFVRMKLGELNDLIGLLGEQENYADLEWLLNSLWSSREVQKNWSPDIIIAIGKRFVQARFLGKHSPQAISLCETICYNLRRVWGALDPKTLDMSDLLSQIYTAAGHHREAMRLHEEILRLVVEGDDGDDRTLDTMKSETAKKHLAMLKQTYQRLGGWDKNASTYKELVDQLLAMPEYKSDQLFVGVQSTDKWNVKEKADSTGDFTKPIDWEFVDPKSLTDKGEVIKHQHFVSKNQRLGYRRVTSNWGMSMVHQHLLGHGDGYEELGNLMVQPAILVPMPKMKMPMTTTTQEVRV